MAAAVAVAVVESDGRVTRSRKRSQQSLTVALELVKDMQEAEAEKAQTPLEPPTSKKLSKNSNDIFL